MKRKSKVILFVFSLIGLGFSVCLLALFYPIPMLTRLITSSISSYPQWNTVLAGYHGVLILCFFVLLLLALFVPNRSNWLVIKKEKGQMEFSKKAIENTARFSFADVDGVQSSTIKAKINKSPEKTKIFVRLSLVQVDEMLSLTETIQSKVASALQLSLGFTPQSIIVKVSDLSQGRKVPETIPEITPENVPETSPETSGGSGRVI